MNDETYEDIREEEDEKYGDECVVCGQKNRIHDNDICNQSCE